MPMVIIGGLTASYELLSKEHWREVVKTIIRRDLEALHGAKKKAVPEAVTELSNCKFSPDLVPGEAGILQAFVATLVGLDKSSWEDLHYGIGFATQELRDKTSKGWDEVLASLLRLVSAIGDRMPNKYRRDILDWIRKRTDIPAHLREALQLGYENT